MELAALLGDGIPKLGTLLTAACAAGVLTVRDDRRRSVLMAVTLVLAAALLVEHIRDTDQFESISSSAPKLMLLTAVGTAALIGLAKLFLVRPQALPLLAIAVLPFRVPIAAAGATVNLLLPLYLVIGAGCLAYLWRQRSDDTRKSTRSPGKLEMALAVFVVLYALQALYSRDFDAALEQLIFFLIPFVVLFRLLVELDWSRTLVTRCAAILVVEALVFCAIGYWEYEQRELFWNPKVIASNQFDSFFRVNSVFWDPNIYGRFLVITMVTLTALMIWSNRGRTAAWAAIALAIMWGGLVLTFSQSSFAALLAGLAVLAALRWDVRRTVYAAVGLMAAGLVFVVAFQGPLNIELSSSSGVEKFTSGRSNLVTGGLELAADRPLWGYGSGGFGRAYRQEQNGNQQESVSASHTMPITVAAEQGIIGLAAYLAVLWFALQALFGNAAHRARSERAPPEDSRAFLTARAAVAAAFVALVVHTMAYAAFLEDPFSWVLMAGGLALAPKAALAGARKEPGNEQLDPATAPA